jgi:two-component system phosphate regulon response regulator PhoB
LNLISHTNNIIPFVILSSDNITYNFDSELVVILKRPFTPYEIINTIRSLLRKSKPVFQNTILAHNELTMNLATYRVLRGKRLIHLGPTEFIILQLLMSDPNRIFSRSEIIEGVWGEKHQIDARTVDVHINRIRVLLKNPDDKYHIIKTVRSLGYSMESGIS